MTVHFQQHGLVNTTDHTVGSQAAVGEVNVVGTNDVPTIVEVVVEAAGVASTSAKIVRRANDGHIAVPVSGQADNEVLSKQQIEALISDGIWKASVHSAVADHTASSVGDGSSGGAALTVGDIVINTTDKKIYTVLTGTGTGAAVTWDAGTLPITAQVRLNELTDSEWVYDTDSSTWLDQGASSHSQQHTMVSSSDHTCGNNKMFYGNASGQVQEISLGAAGAVLISGGASSAPVFASIAIGSEIYDAAGAVPVDSDLATVANDTLGVIKGSTGRVFVFFKNSSDIYYVELTAI